jgi:hypothetical protein
MSKFRKTLLAVAIFSLIFIWEQPALARTIRLADIDIPETFTIELVVQNLSAPTMVAFDDQAKHTNNVLLFFC